MATATIVTDPTTADTQRELQRVETELKIDRKQGVQVDPDTGDVTFWAMAVDKNKTPNRKGYMFDWKQPGDVNVANFEANPVLLYRHESWELPVGMVEVIEVGSRQVRMYCRIPGDIYELAEFRDRIAAGMLRAVSIGFYFDEVSEHPKIQGAKIISKFEIVELSLCSIGAHETALIQQAMNAADGMDVMQHMTGGRAMSWGRESVPAEGRVLHRMSLDGEGTTHHEGTKGTKLERPSHLAPGEDTGGSSTQSTETQTPAWAAMAADQPFGLFVAGDQVKLLHHDDAGEPVWADVAQAMAVVLGARGGLRDVTDPDLLEQGHAHLAEHYRALGIEPPAFQTYTDADLRDLHAAGVIAFPGMAAPTATPPATDPPAAVDRMAAMTETIETLRAEVARLTELAERQTASDVSPPPADPSDTEASHTDPPAVLSDADEQALRYVVRDVLTSDPDACAQRETLAAEVVVEMKRSAGKPPTS